MTISPLSVRQRVFFLLGFVLAWPLLFNGGPLLFSDTTSYIRAADAMVFSATRHPSIWSDVITAAPPAVAPLAKPDGAARPAVADSSSFAKNIILGRSIFYGMILYLGVWLGSLAVPAVLQALLAGAAILGSVRHFADPATERRRFDRTISAVFAVAALTALPYFASFLMPDVFAGLAILAAAIVLSGWERETRGWRLFWVALLCLAALVHSSHVLLLGALGGAGVVLALVRGSGVRRIPVLLVLAAALVGLGGDLAFQRGIGAVLHRAAVRPPFLAMRLIADGPGAAYLRDTCPGSGFALCAYRALPPANSDVLLWSADPRLGIFTAADAAQQRRIADEQIAFAAAVARRYPGWTAATALRNLGVQLGAVGLAEFGVPLLADPEVAARVPAAVRATIQASPAEHGALPTAVYRAIVWPLTLLGLGVMLLAARRGGWRAGAPVALILLGVGFNALVCGTLSTPTDRYQDRVVWLIAVGAVLVWRDAVAGRRAFG